LRRTLEQHNFPQLFKAKKNILSETLAGIEFLLFNKQYLKKHLVVNLPPLSLHPANEKSGRVLKIKC
jgi:hypothetical protein